MSKRDRNDRIALIALAIIVFGAVLAAFFGFIEEAQHSTNYQPTEPDPAYEEQYNPWQDPWSQWTMAVFSAVAAVASVWAVCLLRGTLLATRQIVRDTRRTAQAAVRSTDATLIAANAAKEANDLSRVQFEMAHRPRLKVEVTGYVDEARYSLRLFEDGDGPRWTCIESLVTVRNIGDVPAFITKFYIGVQNTGDIEIGGWGEHPGYHELAKGEDVVLTEHFGRGGGQLPPPFNRAHCGGFNLTRENREQFMDNPPPVVGRIDYRDILGIKRQIGFAYTPTRAWSNDLVRWRGADYNYEKKID